jgi:predicted aspartyl protease
VTPRRFASPWLLLALLLLARCASGPEDSCKLTWRATMPIEVHNNLIFVDVQFDDKPAKLILDTGAERTMLTESAVTRLRLRRDLRHAGESMGIGGPSASYDAQLDSFAVGVFHLPVERVKVGTFELPEVDGVRPDGLLGADILLAFDLDINLPGGQLTMYRARPCTDSRPAWDFPYASVTGVGLWRDRLTVPITLNGADATVVLDTGAQRSTIGRDFAVRAGVTQAMLDADQSVTVVGASRNNAQVRLHRFDTVRIGTEQARGVMFEVAPGSSALGDGLLGEDFLRRRRIWISEASHQLFFTNPQP